MSDKLDCDIEQLQDMLIDLFRHGLIIPRDVLAPNNRTAKAYWLTGAPAPVETKNSSAVMPGKTKIEQAIEFIAGRGKNGSATSAELHALLKLKPHEYASSYLAPPLNDGRLVKDGKTWTLGDGTPRIPRGAAPKAPFGTPEPAATQDVPDVGQVETTVTIDAPPAARTPEPEPLPLAPAVAAAQHPDQQSLPPAPAGTAVQDFSCALWSHGELHLVRGGAELVKLTVEETKHLCEYLDRLGESAEVLP
jgi:hypothetical protein